jgi:photosynthesis system II assembly factor YCF48-like protein
MAAEEDKKFDAVLGGFLANNLRERAERLYCPEPEVLAAYHERSLLPEEMNSWKEHIVGCAHCQAVLAELEATDSILLQASEKEEVVAAGVAAAQPATTAAAVGKERFAMPVAIAAKPRTSWHWRGLRWQWLAPAGALAAGLLVWVVWHENQPFHATSSSEVKIASAEKPVAPEAAPTNAREAPATSSTASSPTDQVAGASKDQNVNGRITSANKSLPPEALKQIEKYDDLSRRPAAPARPSNDKESGVRQDMMRDSSLAANAPQRRPGLDSKAGVAGGLAQTVEVQSAAANAQVQNEGHPQNQVNQLNQKAGGPHVQSQAAQAKKQKSEESARAYGGVAPPAAPAPPPPVPSAAFGEGNTSRAILTASTGPHLIFVPGTKTLWRIGHEGRIEYSSDGGVTWTRQTSNVLVDLTSGFAPSDKVCWIVGRSGTILLTTDAGSRWAIVHSPLDEDLGGVRATDALQATIWNLANTRIFETADGGITWKPAASQ